MEKKHTVNTRTGVFSKKCLFCRKSRKQLKNKCEILYTCSTETIQVFKNIKHIQPTNQLSRYTFIFVQAGIVKEARILDDVEMLRKIGNTESSLEFVCKEVVYHNSCRKKYSYDARASLKKRKSKSNKSAEVKRNNGKSFRNNSSVCSIPRTGKNRSSPRK